MIVKPVYQTDHLNVTMTSMEFHNLKQLYLAIDNLLDNTEDDTCNGRLYLRNAFKNAPILEQEHQ